MYTQTEGNPLFVTEVVRLLVQEGELSLDRSGNRDSWTVRIPEGVREVIGRRLNRLSQRCNDTLTIASVIGREFELGQLEPLVEDISEDRLLEVLEEALSARVIEEMPQAVGRYQFTHALIQETLAAELTLTRRVRLHARIAETLEILYAGNEKAHAAELAHHFVEAEAVLGTEKLVRYSLIAGERASSSYAHEEALAHFRRSLTVKEGAAADKEEPAMDAEAAAILFGLGHAQLAMNQVPEAVSSLTQAFNYYAESGDISRAVAIAENPHSAHFIGELRQVISRAAQLVPPDTLESGRILSNHGTWLGRMDGYEGAQAAFDQALTIAHRNQDAALQMRVLANSANIDGFHMRWEGSLAKSLQAIELASQIDDPITKMRAHLYASVSLLSAMGDVEAARFHLAEMKATAERLRDRVWLERSLRDEIALSYLLGDWPAGRDASDQGLGLLPNSLPLLAQRALIEYQVGEFTRGTDYLERLLDVRRPTHSGPGFVVTLALIAQIASITGSTELFDVAQADAQAVISSPSVCPWEESMARCGLALMAVYSSDVALADQQYAALAPQSGTMHFRGGLPVDRLLGMLAQTMGNLDPAAAHFEDAVTLYRKAGYRPQLAWTRCDYADTLLQRNNPGDREKANSLLDESLAISTELGMRPLMERVLSRRDILKA